MHEEDAAEVWAPQGLGVDVRARQEVWEVGAPWKESSRVLKPSVSPPSDPQDKQESPGLSPQQRWALASRPGPRALGASPTVTRRPETSHLSSWGSVFPSGKGDHTV